MKNSPLVTVFIPTIGRLDYFDSAIISVLNQTYPNLEILVSANGVEKSFLASIGCIHDSRVRLVLRPERLDFISHVNLNLSEASGKYFMLLSDDDLISQDYIASMVDLFESQENVRVGTGRQIQLDSEQRLLPPYDVESGYVVDGHHRWAAIVSHNVKNPDKQIPMNVRVIDDNIDKVIPKANKFAQDIGIAAKSGKEGTKGGPPAAQTKPMAERIRLSSFLKH